MSPRLHFIHSHIESDPSQRQSLLFLTSMVAGIPTVSLEYTADLHPTLYEVLRENLGKAMLNTPLGLPIIYSMLITSTWNLTPRLKGRYIDSWLLSGSTVLHSMLFLDFSNPAYMLDLDDIAFRNRILAWNATCLLHFKYGLPTVNGPLVVDDGMLPTNRAQVFCWYRKAVGHPAALHGSLHHRCTTRRPVYRNR
jgi:hypothetical protein